jgi:glycosyltransferase involved in cell wall biosynthesis
VFENHASKIADMLSQLDVFIAEGERDRQLSKKFGFKGESYIFPSVGGGFEVPLLPLSMPSQRKKILVKGTQDMVRRGLVALRAIERCADVLQEYEIVLYSSNEITQNAATHIAVRTGLKFAILADVDQLRMLSENASARINLCVNMSDGVPNAMLEAMMMGAFPIQSDTSMAAEWIEDSRTGMIVPPEDPEIIERAVRRALQDDRMVDSAMEANRKKIAEELEYSKVRSRVIDFYKNQMHSINDQRN